MNEYSYKQTNQDAFGAWFDSVPAFVKDDWAVLLDKDELNVVAVLREHGQGAGWFDAFIDHLLDWQDFGGVFLDNFGHEDSF